MELYSFALPGDELHRSLGMGIPRGATMLIEGPDTTGKSALCQRFLHGFLQNNHSVGMVSTEQTVKEFVGQMYSINYKIATSLLNEKLLYIPVYPLMKKIKPKKNFIELLMKGNEIFKRDIIIIDTLSSMISSSLVNEIDSKGSMVQLLSFFKRLSALKKTVIYTIDPVQIPSKALSLLRANSHIYLELKMRIIGSYTTRQIMVKRFSHTENPVDDTIGFRVEPGVGVVIEITKYV
jgi:flagellar protein FlaH